VGSQERLAERAERRARVEVEVRGVQADALACRGEEEHLDSHGAAH
jgi:hypothetical protein